MMNKPLVQPIDQPIPVVVDDRECRGDVLSALRADNRFSVQVQRLALGDYRVDTRFLFERKTLSDLVQSIISGRLFRQALRLVGQDDTNTIRSIATFRAPDGFACKTKWRRHSCSTSSRFNAAGGFVRSPE